MTLGVRLLPYVCNKKEVSEMSESRESVAEFLSRGGKITRGKTRKAKGFASLTTGVRVGSTKTRGVEMATRAAIKAERALKK